MFLNLSKEAQAGDIKTISPSFAIAFAASTQTAAYFTFNHINKTIVGTEFNFKMAGNPIKPQYNALMTAMEMQPTYALEPIPSKKKVEKKQSYEGLTMHLMEEYLNIAYEGELAEEARKQFAAMKAKHELKELAYPTIKSWFLDLFPKFNVEKAIKEVQKHRLGKVKAKYRPVKLHTKATSNNELPKASGQYQ